MPKITFIHTSDLHLEERKTERIETLKWIMEKARECEAAVIISGDLFNSDQDAYSLDSAIRKIFGEYREITTFIIPGNHDKNAYVNDIEYGDNVKLLRISPFTEIHYKGIKLIGVPHQGNSCLMQALNNLQYTELSVLLVHGTFFDDSTQCVRDEVKRKGEDYFPVFAEDIVDKNIVYIAMGHFHSKFMIIDNYNKKICYPGTPVSLDDSETGLRKAAKVVIDTESRELEVSGYPVDIGTYRLRNKFTVYPGKEGNALRAVIKYLSKNVDNRADVKIELNGFTKTGEIRLNKVIQSITNKYNNKFFRLNIINNTISYQHLLERHILVREFISRLESYDISNTIKNRTVELGIKAFDSELS